MSIPITSIIHWLVAFYVDQTSNGSLLTEWQKKGTIEQIEK